MSSVRLLELIGEVGETYVDDTPIECIAAHHKRLVWLRLTAVAACIAIIVCAGFGVYRYQHPQGIVYPRMTSLENLWEEALYAPSEMLCAQSGSPSRVSYAAVASGKPVIVVGDVVDIHLEDTHSSITRIDGTHIYQAYVKVTVSEVVKGTVIKTGQTIYVQEAALYEYYDKNGKHLGTKNWLGVPPMKKGNRVLLFLDSSVSCVLEDGTPYYWYGSGAAKLYYDKDGKFHSSILYNRDFPEEYTPLYGLIDYEPKTVEEIRKLIIGNGETWILNKDGEWIEK